MNVVHGRVLCRQLKSGITCKIQRTTPRVAQRTDTQAYRDHHAQGQNPASTSGQH
jgi:hypothetical protein